MYPSFPVVSFHCLIIKVLCVSIEDDAFQLVDKKFIVTIIAPRYGALESTHPRAVQDLSERYRRG